MFFEIIGYAASFVVLISFLTASVVKLRLINMVGCLLFVLYGILIKAYPVALMNAIVVVIQIYFLYKMLKSKSEYRIVRCTASDNFLKDFIKTHLHDIKKYLPGFVSELPDDALCYMCMVNEELAGVWVTVRDGSKLNVLLEYVKEKFRDCGMGRYIYHNRRELFQKDGIKTVIAAEIYGTHAEYLQKIGFMKEETPGKYTLDISKPAF